MTPIRATSVAAVVAACAVVASAASIRQAQPQTAQTQTAQPQPSKPAEAAAPAEPTLDELLGITPAKPADGDPRPAGGPLPEGQPKPDPARPGAAQPTDTTRTELDRALSPEEIRDDFARAVALMDESSQRLNTSRDPGLATQRLQENILQMLDKLINDAEQQQQQSQSSSSSSSSSSSQQSQPRGAQSQQQAARGTGMNTGTGPARQDAQPNPAAAGNSATWGNLPDHLRDALVQGASDRFSEMYRSLTEEYYKRLAEEPVPGGGPR